MENGTARMGQSGGLENDGFEMDDRGYTSYPVNLLILVFARKVGLLI